MYITNMYLICFFIYGFEQDQNHNTFYEYRQNLFLDMGENSKNLWDTLYSERSHLDFGKRSQLQPET